MKNFTRCFFTCALLIASTHYELLSQSSSSTIPVKAVLEACEGMAQIVIETAEAMSAEYYTFKPHPDHWGFAEQVGHTPGANYLFAFTVKSARPKPIPTTDSQKKDQLVKEPKASFQFVARGVEKWTDQDLKEEVEFFGKRIFRLQAFLITTSQPQREQGKTKTDVWIKEVAAFTSPTW